MDLRALKTFVQSNNLSRSLFNRICTERNQRSTDIISPAVIKSLLRAGVSSAPTASRIYTGLTVQEGKGGATVEQLFLRALTMAGLKMVFDQGVGGSKYVCSTLQKQLISYARDEYMDVFSVDVYMNEYNEHFREATEDLLEQILRHDAILQANAEEDTKAFMSALDTMHLELSLKALGLDPAEERSHGKGRGKGRAKGRAKGRGKGGGRRRGKGGKKNKRKKKR